MHVNVLKHPEKSMCFIPASTKRLKRTHGIAVIFAMMFFSLLFPWIGQASEITEIRQIEFQWDGNGTFSVVTLPHSINADNGTGTKPLLHGEGVYRLKLNVEAKDLPLARYLQFEQAGQRAKIFLNGKQIAMHTCGYTPFAIRLTDLRVGDNEIIIKTDNRIAPKFIPNSGDFNFCNGIYGKLFLLRGSILLDPTVYGIDRFHVTTLEVSKENVNFSVKTNVFATQSGTAELRLRVISKDGKCAMKESVPFNLQSGGNEFRHEYTLKRPILWQGMSKPYLYRIEIAVVQGDNVLDTAQIAYGFRTLAMPSNTEEHYLRLNGQPIVLRGVALHQDCDGTAAAMTDCERARDQEIIRELGCNFLRCAHYPHNVNEFRAYDRMGLLCQTEIPWVNTFTAGADYAEHTMQYIREMVSNLYNHPSIAFWGISNELRFSEIDPGFSDLHNAAIRLLQKMDPSRPAGFVTNKPADAAARDLTADWCGCNTYPGWYTKKDFKHTSDVTRIASKLARFPLYGISEYGYGANPVHHNRDFMTICYRDRTNTTGTSSGHGGHLHPEEYQTFAHVYEWNRIAGTQKGKQLAFTSVWILFDFAVSARDEGGLPGVNDKGLVTRDRKIKKDAFYFYKCVWNPAPEVHIVSSRWQVRDTPQIDITVFANVERVELYRNGEKIAELTEPSDAINKVVWNFPDIPFTIGTGEKTPNNFTAIGFRGEKEVARDTATISSNTGVQGTLL